MDDGLNLTPYLDVSLNLVTFLLVATLPLVPMSAAQVDVPPYGPGKGGTEPLAVVVHRDGYELRGAAPAVLAGHDPVALAAALRARKAEATALRVAADPDVAYADLVATLDAARADAQGPLFPHVSLAVGIRQDPTPGISTP